MNSLHIHRQLVHQMRRYGCPLSKPQRNNLALLCQGLAFSPNCRLGTLALYLPVESDRDSLVERLRRLLKHRRVSQLCSYAPLLRLVFANWAGCEVPLVMDRTDIGNRWSILSLGIAYRCRLLPLAWQVLSFGGTSAQVQQDLLRQVKPWLSAWTHVRVHFFADCEFRAVEVQQLCREWRWHWQVGLKSDILFHQGDGHWKALGTILLRPGERRDFQAVTLTEKHAFGPVNLIADWNPNQAQPRYFALDLPADLHAWRRGRKRFWIEPT